MIEYIKKKFRTAMVALSYGLKNTETDILGQKTTTSESNSVEQKMQQNDLAEALLKGEVTEQVEMLRDRTYLISDESKIYKVVIDTVGTTKAVKKMGRKPEPKAFNEIGFGIIMVMDNRAIPTGVLSGLEAVGGYGIKDKYPINFKYEYSPKFKLDEYVTRLILRGDGDNLVIDLYIPKFTESINRLEKIFDNELNKIKTGKIKPNNIKFKTLNFISDRAYGTEDLIPYEFEMVEFLSINEFDGRHVLTYSVNPIGDNKKITDKYINKKLRDAYKNKESRGLKLNIGDTIKEVNCCEKCGKNVDNVYDFRITKKTLGIGVCADCLIEINKEK